MKGVHFVVVLKCWVLCVSACASTGTKTNIIKRLWPLAGQRTRARRILARIAIVVPRAITRLLDDQFYVNVF